VPEKLYYGRGWFHLSYPSNYYLAGNALGLDLFNNIDMVSQQQDVAVKTMVWLFQINNMAGPAQQDDFVFESSIPKWNVMKELMPIINEHEWRLTNES
jgi:predicted chitinase